MRSGFTMIEIIFAIVIIGILAAVAIPRLNATRGDSEGAKVAYNLAICVNDAGNTFMKTGYFSGDKIKADSLPSDSVACTQGLIPSGESEACFNIAVSDSSGTLTVTNSASSTAACKEAQRLAGKNGVGEKTHEYNF